MAGWIIALTVMAGIFVLSVAAYIRTGASVIEDPVWSLPLMKLGMGCGVIAFLAALFIRWDKCGGLGFFISGGRALILPSSIAAPGRKGT